MFTPIILRVNVEEPSQHWQDHLNTNVIAIQGLVVHQKNLKKICCFYTLLSPSMFNTLLSPSCFFNTLLSPSMFNTLLSPSMFLQYPPLTLHVSSIPSSHPPCFFITLLSPSMSLYILTPPYPLINILTCYSPPTLLPSFHPSSPSDHAD